MSNKIFFEIENLNDFLSLEIIYSKYLKLSIQPTLVPNVYSISPSINIDKPVLLKIKSTGVNIKVVNMFGENKKLSIVKQQINGETLQFHYNDFTLLHSKSPRPFIPVVLNTYDVLQIIVKNI